METNRIREEWRNKLRDFDYTNHRGQGLEEFISELLKSQKEELVESLEKIVGKNVTHSNTDFSKGYKQCQENILKELSLIKEE